VGGDENRMLAGPLRDWESVVAEARKYGPRRVVVAAPHDAESVKAVRECTDLGLGRFVLVGDEHKIEAIAGGLGISLDDCQFVSEPDPLKAARRSAMIAGSGEADAIMKGKVNTADLIRAVLDREVGLRTGHWLSGTIVMEIPGLDRLTVLSDASLSIAPNVQQKAEMIENAVATARAVGITAPKVAVLTAFEFVNPEMPATVDAASLAVMGQRGQIAGASGATIEGPIALDLAVSEEAAAQKGYRSPVAGRADVFLCPDVEAANIMLRAIIYFARGKVGGIIQGARVPIVLLSRAEPAETKVNSVALAVLASRSASGAGGG
jgi:phosphate butyryltransferase